MFEQKLKELNIKHKLIKPYTPRHNGKVERSHREDGKVLYNRKVFTSEKDLINQVAKHERRYNSTAKTSLKFKSPDEVVEEYFKNTSYYYEN
ncbi:MAG: transposase [Peptostreptococcus sp.]|nr:transposase [Peptostreptococcus sp.]